MGITPELDAQAETISTDRQAAYFLMAEFPSLREIRVRLDFSELRIPSAPDHQKIEPAFPFRSTNPTFLPVW